MTGVCAMCHREFENIGVFSEYRGNCRRDTFACVKCKKIRSSNGGTCLTCKYYDTSKSDSADEGGCLRYHRKVEFADRCGQYEEDEE